ncbi:glucosamine-6-phosphate deaminase [Spiroplasma taiwanense]|uniref:Glucosamine-6-phosphate deaminase n=1 Tax=Spiroplasma taiwanense CT-1 TaxID=1276220 RepID=S5LW83_9MOLU|nr:glucosamine-6-phosphate deaminase [Spiroplasma taiwanense]AGR40866.1 glucosamine-6-phosphate deaminase [Spiroplasma taiwanense CT-1]
MKVIKVINNNKAGEVAGDIILNIVKNKANAILGLATGSTPISTYKYLIEKTKNQKVDWSNIKSFNLDEYKGLSSEHKQSYRYFMNNTFFDHINIDKKNTFVPDGLIETNEQAAKYDKDIKMAGGIDIQLLGLGINGHIVFNEPGTLFDSITSIVDLTQSTIEVNSRFFKDKKDVPNQAISMGLNSIMKAKEIVLIATGKSKAEAVKHLIEGPISKDWPCTILLEHPNITVIIDGRSIRITFLKSFRGFFSLKFN